MIQFRNKTVNLRKNLAPLLNNPLIFEKKKYLELLMISDIHQTIDLTP